ncbi:MAG TPA: hypothetical protein VMJ75_16645 [Candidatus Acidoferrales bacterium]|nr:hypothetical protein [Candidatus Acidoferrales bacterium]
MTTGQDSVGKFTADRIGKRAVIVLSGLGITQAGDVYEAPELGADLGQRAAPEVRCRSGR